MKKNEALAQGKEPKAKKLRVSKKLTSKKTPEKKSIFTEFEQQAQGMINLSIYNLTQKTKIKEDAAEAGFMKLGSDFLPLFFA